MAGWITMDQGEYQRIEVVDEFRQGEHPWDDLSGVSVSMRLRNRDTNAAVTVAGDLDSAGPDGKIHGAGAVVPSDLAAGRYDGELVLEKAGQVGYPQVYQFMLRVIARPAATP